MYPMYFLSVISKFLLRVLCMACIRIPYRHPLHEDPEARDMDVAIAEASMVPFDVCTSLHDSQ